MFGSLFHVVYVVKLFDPFAGFYFLIAHLVEGVSVPRSFLVSFFLVLFEEHFEYLEGEFRLPRFLLSKFYHLLINGVDGFEFHDDC